MPLFAIHLLFSLEVQTEEAPDPVHELVIHVLSAADEEGAARQGEAIGRNGQHAWRNQEDEEVRRAFLAVAEVQSLDDAVVGDGMAVSSWLWQGERLVIEESWLPDASARMRRVR